MITRRKFMKLLTGSLVGTMFAPKSLVGKVKIKQEIIDEEDIHLIKASEIVSDGLTASDIKVETISRTEYNVVDDLVEEVNKYNTKNSGLELQYFVYCNYSGLAILDWTGRLDYNEYEPDQYRGYWYILEGTKIKVVMNQEQKADIMLLVCTKEKYSLFGNRLIAQRCFNIDMTKEGQALWEGDF